MAPQTSVKSNPHVRPARPPVHPENIPQALQVQPRWVVWRWTLKGNKWNKPPRQTNGAMASSNNSETWTTFQEALAAYESGKFDGIGLVLPDTIVGVDLDNARNPVDGSFSSDAEMYLEMCKTYTEISPSGEGLKSLCFGHLSPSLQHVSHERGVEMYAGGETNRYFTLTGDIIGREHSVITGQRESLYGLQCMISDPIHEIVKPDGVDNTPDLLKAREYLSCLKPHRASDYTSWLTVGMALHSVSEDPALFQLWDTWSSQDPSYSSLTCTDKWDSFSRERSGRIVSLGSLRRMATEDGYREAAYLTRSKSLSDLLATDVTRNYLIKDMLVEGEPMIIGGASKTLKTTVMLDMMVSLAAGTEYDAMGEAVKDTKFLGEFEVETPRRVMVISGESGEATIQENLVVLLGAKYGWAKAGTEATDTEPAVLGTPNVPATVASNLHVSFDLPKLDDAMQVADLIEDLREKDIKIVVIDPLYRALRCGDNASNVYAMGEQLELISTQLLANGITVILCHHFRKQGKTYSESPELEDLSMSGVAEFGRQFLLLKRRKQYEMNGKHDIWFSWGGSAGHQGLKILEAFTGTRVSGVKWQASLADPHALELAEKAATEERELQEAEEAELKLLRLIPFDKPRNKKDIKEDMGLTAQKLNAMLKPLVAGDLVEEHGSRSNPSLVLGGQGHDRKVELETKYQEEDVG